MPTRTLQLGITSAIVALATLAGGCATGGANEGQSTRLRASDMLVATDEIAQALGDSQLMASRSIDSPVMRLYVLAAENRSTERLSRIDGSVMMSQIVLDERMMDLLRSKAVEIYYPDDTAALLREFYGSVPGAGRDNDLRPGATHFMTGEVRSITRQAGQAANAVSDARTDLFSLTVRIVDADTSAALWAHDARVRRLARGVVAD
jgi:hypothetical protein